MTKAIIIDDEEFSTINLKWKIENFTQGVEVLATFNDPEEGLAYLRTHPIDLLFLDIEMPNMNGFELLQSLNTVDFDVIFTTAYDEFGIKAIKYSALDYLLKPVQEEELAAAVAKHQSKNRPGSTLQTQLDLLLHNMNQNTLEQQRIALATKEEIELVYPKDIILCQGENNYTYVFLTNQRKKLISRTLRNFEDLLGEHHFFRIHQSYLVNTRQMVKYIRKDGGYVLMSNGVHVPISRSKREALLKFF